MVGDDPCCLILDSNSGEKVAELKGHVDYSFAAAWHPSGTQLATGNQVSNISFTCNRSLHPQRSPLPVWQAEASLQTSPWGFRMHKHEMQVTFASEITLCVIPKEVAFISQTSNPLLPL